MYKSFEVTNFRCFDHLKVDDLERVNLIAGLNNVGKTALLEALFLHCGGYRPERTLSITGFRGIQGVRLELGQTVETPWDSIFTAFDTSKEMKLVAEETSGKRAVRLWLVCRPEELAQLGLSASHVPQAPRESSVTSKGGSPSPEMAKVLGLEYEEPGERKGRYYLILDAGGKRTQPIPPAPHFPAFFHGARMQVAFKTEAERFGKLQFSGEEDVLLEVLRLVEPRLRVLKMIVVVGEPMLHGDIGLGRPVPLPIMGEGVARLATLVLHIANARNGVVLVDEIENGLHHSVLTKVWQAVGKVARHFGTQVFATTHSLECIAAAHQAFSESERYDFRLHRLERVRGTIRAVTYRPEVLGAAIDTGLEVR